MTNKEQQLLTLAQAMYAERGGRIARPMYPFVLVWILPKEQQVGLIITPDKQNKVMHEGVVINIWRPFWKLFRTKTWQENCMHCAHGTPDIIQETEVHMVSGFKPGDQILFPHWAGVPTDLGKTEGKEFRMIKEHTTYNPPDLAVGKWEYDQASVVRELQDGLMAEGIYPHHVADATERLLKKYYVVRKLGQTARTISGL
jgi:hypothetical protein